MIMGAVMAAAVARNWRRVGVVDWGMGEFSVSKGKTGARFKQCRVGLETKDHGVQAAQHNINQTIGEYDIVNNNSNSPFSIREQNQ
jgi:hypothetical protein